MRKTILTILLLAATFSFMGCCNSQTHAEEIDEIQIIEPVDTLANIPMTIKFTSVYIPCTVNGKTKLFILDPEWKHNCIEKRFISDIAQMLITFCNSIRNRNQTHWTNSQTGQPDDPYKRWGCDGSIGLDIISLYNWIIDYRNDKIYYSPNEHYKKKTKQ